MSEYGYKKCRHHKQIKVVVLKPGQKALVVCKRKHKRHHKNSCW